MTEAKEALKTGDVETLKKAKETLMTASHKLAELIYKEAAAKAQAGAGAGGPAGSTAGTTNGSAEGNGHAAHADAVDAEVVDEGKK